MWTILPRAAVATVVASAMGVGAFLFPLDASGLIGHSPVERSAAEFDALVSAVYPRPGRIDVGAPRLPDRHGLPTGAAHLVLETEMLLLDGTHRPLELMRALDAMRSMPQSPQSWPVDVAGSQIAGRALSLSPEDLLKLVVLVENLLQSMAGTPEPDLAELLTNVVATVVGGLDTSVATPVPVPESNAAVPRAPAVAPAPVPALIEPASEPPETEPPTAPAAPLPAQPQINPTSAAPSPDVAGAGDAPTAEVTSQPPPAAPPESDEETAVSPQSGSVDRADSVREPDNPDPDTNSSDPESNSTSSDNSSDGNDADKEISSQEKDASNE